MLNNANLIGDSKGLFPKLRCLVWSKRPASVATSFHLEKLVVLYLSECDISELWEGWSHLKVASQLKFLGLVDCHLLKVTPDLSAFRKLEKLTFEGCRNLVQVHSSIGEAKGLIFLSLQRCEELHELPQEMGKLEELKELHIGETGIGEIPPCIRSLKKLEILKAGGCNSLVGVLDSISQLVNLSTLDLSHCSGLCTLPESIGSLVKLQRLSFGGPMCCIQDLRSEYTLHRIPNSIGKLEWLIELNSSCSGICELPESIGDLKILKILNIAHCGKLSNLPSTISKLGNLEELDATECKSLGGKIPIDGLSSLKILRLRSTRFSDFPDAFNTLEKLDEFDAAKCKILGGEIPIDRLPSLKILRLTSTCISSFPDAFDKLSHLEELILYKCKMLQSLPQSISKLRSLQHLDLTRCHELQSLPELPACLTVLGVTCQSPRLPQLSHLIHLKELTMADCQLLESMPKLPSGLLELRVDDCGQLKELPSLSSLEFS